MIANTGGALRHVVGCATYRVCVQRNFVHCARSLVLVRRNKLKHLYWLKTIASITQQINKQLQGAMKPKLH